MCNTESQTLEAPIKLKRPGRSSIATKRGIGGCASGWETNVHKASRYKQLWPRRSFPGSEIRQKRILTRRGHTTSSGGRAGVSSHATTAQPRKLAPLAVQVGLPVACP